MKPYSPIKCYKVPRQTFSRHSGGIKSHIAPWVRGVVSREIPRRSHRDVECEVHQDSDIGSPTSSCTLDIDFVRLTPVSCHTVDSTKPLVLLFHLQRESLRPDTSSSPWNQEQQHEDDFPGSCLS